MVTQIGWYNLKEESIFENTFETAAWYERVLVKPGKYPLVCHDLSVVKHKDERYNNMVTSYGNSCYVTMDRTIVSDYFATLFFGVPVGDYDSTKNAGNPSCHTNSWYNYMVAESIVTDKNTPFELFPDFEIRGYSFTYDGETQFSYSIYKKEE